MLMPSIFGETFMDDFLDGFAKPAYRSIPNNAVMKTDIKEKADSFTLEMDLPGYKKEDVKADLKDGYLTINAEHKEETEDKDKDGKYLRRERYYGNCSRSFYVGEDVTQEDIKAKFENGILSITVPKVEAKPAVEEKHYIAIEG